MVAAIPIATTRTVDRIETQVVRTAPAVEATVIRMTKIGHVDADHVGDAQNLVAEMAEMTVTAANYVAPKFRLGTKRSRR